MARMFLPKMVLFLALAICLHSQGNVQAAPKRYALLIGVTSYEATQLNQPRLYYPEADAKAIADKLRSHGYIVTLLVGEAATQSAIRGKLAELQKEGNEDGVVVVGLFGHGIETQGSDEAMYCPYDTGMRIVQDKDGKNILDDDGNPLIEPNPKMLISMREVLNALRICKAGNKLLLADCCRNDPNTARGRAFGTSVKLTDLPNRTACLFACSTGEKAYEHDDWQHGAMTKAFLDHFSTLESSDGSVMEITARISRSVKAMVRDKTDGKRSQTLHPIINGIVELKLEQNKLVDYMRKNGFLKATLYPGRPAPPLPPLKVIEGNPISKYPLGRPYVVTSHGIINIRIFRELLNRFPNLGVFDIDVSKHFYNLKEKLPLGYSLCHDASSSMANDGKFWAEWNKPADVGSDPTAFIVDQNGNIAWIGWPGELIEVMKQVLDGTWDLKKAEEAYLESIYMPTFGQHLTALVGKKMLNEARSNLKELQNCELTVREKSMIGAYGLFVDQAAGVDTERLISSYKAVVESCNFDLESCNIVAWGYYQLLTTEDQGSKKVMREMADVLKQNLSSSDLKLYCESLDTLAHLEHAIGNLDVAIKLETEVAAKAPQHLRTNFAKYLETLRSEK